MSLKSVKTRCPHCQGINEVAGATDNLIAKCAHCGESFRLRKRAAEAKPPPPSPVAIPKIKRFPIRCTCGTILSVTYAEFGKRVKCQSCNQWIKIPDWVAETKFTTDEFDDMFSDEELRAQGRKR